MITEKIVRARIQHSLTMKKHEALTMQRARDGSVAAEARRAEPASLPDARIVAVRLPTANAGVRAPCGARRAVEEVFQRGDAGAVAVEPVLVAGDALLDLAPAMTRPCRCGRRARRSRRSCSATVSGMPIMRRMPALTRPRIRSPSKVTTGRSCASASSVVLPPDQPMLSSMSVALRARRGEAVHAPCRAGRRNDPSALSPAAAKARSRRCWNSSVTLAAEMPDEHELAVAGLASDAREHLVVLRQILEQRLRAPIGRRSRAQPQLLARHRRRRELQRLIVEADVGQSHQLFRIVLRRRPAARSVRR